MAKNRSWTDDRLREAVIVSRSYRNVLLLLGLIPAGGNAAGLKFSACEIFGWAKQAEDGRIPVELDHNNGNKRDNRLQNLRIVCPNCHSLQITHRGKNKKVRLTRVGNMRG